jgi:DNA (cytosine-5)-methyltransferase 1
MSPPEKTARKRAGTVDLLIGGPPCQGHSTLNNHTRGRDPKNGLYLRMVRAAEVLEPERLIIENVPAIERDEDGVLETATRRLESLGYRVDAMVVSVADIGAPQLRKRHILAASTSGNVEVAATVEAATELLDAAAKMSPENLKRAHWLLKHAAFDLPNWLRPACHRDKPDHKYKSMYGRLRWDEPAQTITTGFGSPGQGRYLHPEQPRTITPHEAARLQVFPDWFSFGSAPFRSALAESIGNAVPVKLGFVAGIAALSGMERATRRSRRVAQGGR